MVYVKLMGGLGNMLFQIATGVAYGLEHNKKVFFVRPIANQHGNMLRYFDDGAILGKIKNRFTDPILGLNSPTYIEPKFSYSQLPVYNFIITLNGYFQTEKYFIKYRNHIVDLFYNEEVINSLQKKLLNISKTVSLHIRRGDYLKYPDIHPTQNIDYYKNAMSYFDDNHTFIIFSDDIRWCKENFKNLPYDIKYMDSGLEDYEELWLMSLCNHNIIANSSFSWWGAWLNRNDNIVIAPKKWFGKKATYDDKDIIPDNWIKI